MLIIMLTRLFQNYRKKTSPAHTPFTGLVFQLIHRTNSRVVLIQAKKSLLSPAYQYWSRMPPVMV